MFLRIGPKAGGIATAMALVLLPCGEIEASQAGKADNPSSQPYAPQFQGGARGESDLAGSPELWKFRLMTVPLGGR